ncbi:dynamin family protein [Clostridium tarantellae]|uniref:Dynamin N-terminal domain-containing protein n=1 Tax=Clostridium tarantellae TaxID=39493 RepID=A0A6I1MLC8_9CLOT|nr:dynamin family protein [Clostridium tarantellae]MPQ44316.1 hypothetical protein [Clostridium tarantellae]
MDMEQLEKFNINPKEIQKYIDKINNSEKVVAITGEFSSGKTTFINALIGKKDFLSTGNGECTPILIEIIKGNNNVFEVHYKDNSVSNEKLNKENLLKYSQYKEGYDTNILGITVPIDNKFIGENVTLIDTPGTNTIIKEHEEITEYILKRSDIVLYIINKVISASDIERIKEIEKYTNHIILIVTNMDEKIGDNFVNRSEDDINKLIDEVKKEVSKSLGVKEFDILPIGSKASFTNSKYINDIREVINDYININKKEVIKNRVKGQLELLFKNKYEEIKKELSLIEELKNNDREELIKKIDRLEQRISKANKNSEGFNKEFSENKKNIEKSTCNKLKELFESQQYKFLKEINKQNEINEDFIEEGVYELSNECNAKIRGIIEKQLDKLVNEVFQNGSEELDDLINDLDLNFEVDFDAPTLEELSEDFDEFSTLQFKKLKRVKEKQMNIERELGVTEENISMFDENLDHIYKKAKTEEDTYQNLFNKKLDLGSYKAEYEIVYDEDGSDLGAKTGRVIGEVADFALMFWSPSKSAGTLAKGADAFKDLAKGVKIVGNAAKKVEKGAKKAKNFKKSQNSALKMLQYLEFGYYGEALGRKVGGAIKPSKSRLVENEDKKQEYLDRKEQLEKAICENNIKRQSLDREIAENKISMAAARRKRVAMKANMEAYEKEEQNLIESIEKLREKDSKEKLNKYYSNAIEDIINDQLNNANKLVKEIIDEASERAIIKSKEMFIEKVNSLKEALSITISNKDIIENEINTKKVLLADLSSYRDWINEWVQ